MTEDQAAEIGRLCAHILEAFRKVRVERDEARQLVQMAANVLALHAKGNPALEGAFVVFEQAAEKY